MQRCHEILPDGVSASGSTRCLSRGDPCVYDPPVQLLELGEQHSVATRSSSTSGSLSNALGGMQVDLFGSMEIEMPYNSHQSLHHCTPV